MSEEGFGKLSQLRTDEQVIADAKKLVGVLNEVLEVLSERGYRVDTRVNPIMYIYRPTRRYIEIDIYQQK